MYQALDPFISHEIHKLIKLYHKGMSVEYFDNRISRYSKQEGKCAVTKRFLLAKDLYSHHKQPKFMSGSDAFYNVVIVHPFVHKLIHATKLKDDS
ncbi:MAG TPA: hypothetical protein VNR61_05390 [Niallia sp.]|nr:hypothetical protein [Niallia sp.]